MNDIKDFVMKEYPNLVDSGVFKCSSPSNIALVKYWGKKENQIPTNPSLSFTLSNCKTITSLSFEKKQKNGKLSFDLFFDGKQKEEFKPKIEKFFNNIEVYTPFIKDYHFIIESQNTFPHSSGIASSASGMAALAVNLMSLEKALNPDITKHYFNRKASLLARLGSGSACRSVNGDVVVWGKHTDIHESSDLYGVEFPFEINSIYKDYQDTILLIDKGKKQVSSSVGHSLMHKHPYANIRFEQANANLAILTEVLRNGNIERFIQLVESEALTLHAMMMTSIPYFILMKPNTLEVINAIWKFREDTKNPLCFTLDAGANVHLLYPESIKNTVLRFIDDKLIGYCENGEYICDQIGKGSVIL